MRNLYGLLLGLSLLCCQAIFAQTQQVTGKVTDSRDGSPLGGVTVKIKGANGATVTSSEGTFRLTAPSSASTLVFSSVGYKPSEAEISPEMTVALAPAEKNLSEVVVVGYGRVNKRDLSGSIAKVSAKDIENLPVQSFESAMQGKAAGVVIESGSGKVGQGIKIRIRGTSSISASSQPLYVVDGLPITSTSQSDATNEPTNPLIDINPNDIESIEVLKDASAAAIYGARAANGVVLVTTKKGKNRQRTTLELNASKGYSNPSRKWKFLDAKGYVDLIEQAATSDGTYDFENGFGMVYNPATGGLDPGTVTTLPDAINNYKQWYEANVLDQYSLGTDWRKLAVNTNWQDLLYNKNAQTNQLDLSAYGGDAKTRFFVSGFYNTQEATVINNKFGRYGGRLNLEHNASDKLTLGISLAVNRSQLDRVSDDNAFSTPGQLVAQLPISPVIDPATNKLSARTLYANGLYDAQFSSDRQVTFRTIGNAFASYTFFPGFNFRSEFGADILNLTQEQFRGRQSIDGSGTKGQGGFILSQSATFNTNNYFTYTPRLGANNKLTLVAGMSYLQSDTKGATANGEQYPSDAVKNLSGATSITFATSTNIRYTFLSYFARANYALNNRYLLSASLRADGSSRFSPDHRYGVFPAVSAGWVMSDEDFFKSSLGFLSFFKLRASWGQTGNAEIGEGNFLSLYNVSNYPGLPGFTPAQLGNPDLKWEKTGQTDVGLDFGIIGNRITGELDYYKKHTTDLLVNVNVPSTTGYNSLFKNVGSMDNQGVEITLNSDNLTGAFKWSTSINAAYNKNKVLDINGQIIESAGGVQRAVQGQPIGVFFMQKFLGVDPQTGDALYLGKDGKPTNDYGSADRVVVGKANPTWTGGFTNTFSYGGFDLSVFFNFVQGSNVFNLAGVYQTQGFFNGFDNQTIDLLNAWKKPGDKTNVPRIGYWYGSGADAPSSRWLYDASYIRLRNVTLGYTLPKSVTGSLKIQSARFYITGMNLWTKTKYPGDPEVNTFTLGNINSNQDFYNIPQPRTITAGLNIKF